jgi:hypothetical protein
MKSYRLTCDAFVARVQVDDSDVIRWAAPVVRKFLGQPLDQLKTWMKKYGGFNMQVVSSQPGLFGEDGGTTGPDAA